MKVAAKYQDMNQEQHNKGFTLIELLIVMVIMGILTTIAASSFITSQQKSRDARRKQDLANVGKALEAYYNDKGQYPLSDATGQIEACANQAGETIACSWGSPMLDARGTYYMPQLPEDPRGYTYIYISTLGADYQLYARLENTKDAAVPKAEDGETALVYTGISCGTGGTCNYGLPSTNSFLAGTGEE